jgi:TPP-dependent indolepyruvate ferredoxin oxidoreductase alpha subunit
MGHSILGYGMSLASRAGVSPMMQRRTLAIMGDGGFWHNGLLDRGAERAVQRRRRGAADLQERLHLGHRHAGNHLHTG